MTLTAWTSTFSGVTSPAEESEAIPPEGPSALRIHAGLALCLAICIPAFAIEINRALGGNSLSWAYVFEWPLFIAIGVYLWWRLLHEDSSRRRPPPSTETEDAQLVAWNQYLADLHASERADGSTPHGSDT